MIDEEYASLVALCQVIPGPTSSQLGMGLGFNLGGIKGAIAAWSGFTLPSVIIMVVAALWVLQGGSLSAGWLIAAMKIVAVGVVTHALLGMWYQLCTDRETKINRFNRRDHFLRVPGRAHSSGSYRGCLGYRPLTEGYRCR